MTRRNRLIVCAALLAGAAAISGCPSGPQQVSKRPPPPVADVEGIVPLTPPAATNWDGRPGADGLQVSVLLFRPGEGLPVTVRGALECVVYEGIIRGDQLTDARPWRSWRFGPDDLRQRVVRTAYGWGYAVILPWGPTGPGTSSVTLVVRYHPPEGPAVASQATVVPVTAK